MRALVLPVLALLLAGCSSTNSTPSTSDSAGFAERADTQSFTLPPDGSIEWKLRMQTGGALDYSWSANRPVYFDFHGDYDDGTEAFVSHKSSTLASDREEFLAPFTGRHGWYWQNGNAQTVTITLTTKGEYEVIGRTGGNAP